MPTLRPFPFLLLISCALLCFYVSYTAAQTSASQCSGQYDVYFVLDRTGSMSGGPFKSLMSFVQFFLNNFAATSTSSRFIFVTFSETAELQCNGALTRDAAIQCAKDIAANVKPDGATYIGSGIRLATEQLKQRKNSGNIPLMLLVTDGGENACPLGAPTAPEAAVDARAQGANLYVVGIMSSDLKEDFLKQIVGPGNGAKFKMVDSADQLTGDLSQTIASALCTEVKDIKAVPMCLKDLGSSSAIITLSGSGLVDDKGKAKVTCNFISATGQQYPTSKVTVHDPTSTNSDVICEIPTSIGALGTTAAGEYRIQIVLNGGASSPAGTVTSKVQLNDCGGNIPAPPPSDDVGARVASVYGKNEFCAANGSLTVSLLVRRMSPNVATECKLQLEEPEGNPQAWPTWNGKTNFRQVVADNYNDGTCDFSMDCTVDKMELKVGKTYYVYLYDLSGANPVRLTGRGQFHAIECLETAAIWPYVAAASVLLLLLLLWFFWPYLVGTIVYKPKPVAAGVAPAPVETAPPPPPPVKAPPRKWGVVDASKYIWARDGGTARPINVKWGEMGPTPMSGNIEAAGDETAFMEADKLNNGGGDGSTTGAGKSTVKGASGGRTTCWFSCCACFFGTICGCWAATYEKCAAVRPKRVIYRVRKE